jgi:hypothetical protein
MRNEHGRHVMKKLLSSFLIVFLLVESGYAAGVADLDGNDWVTMDEVSKMSFTGGFLVGSSYVIDENTVPLPNSFNPEEASKLYFDGYIGGKRKKLSRHELNIMLQRVENSRNEKLSNYALSKIPWYKITVGLDKLYRNSKNRSIRVTDAIYVVKKQAEGLPETHIEKILLYLQLGKKDLSPLMVVDEKGKVVSVIRFP